MVLDIVGYLFYFCSLDIIYTNKVLIIITQFKIGFIKNLIFLNVRKHHKRTAIPTVHGENHRIYFYPGNRIQ